jgi:hypothetical protein
METFTNRREKTLGWKPLSFKIPRTLITIGTSELMLELSASLPFRVVPWEVQNTIYAPLIKAQQEWRSETEKGQPGSAELAERVHRRK